MRKSGESVPLSDLKAQYRALQAELDEAVREVVESCRFIGGPAVEGFAREYAAYCGVQHAIPCANGTEAVRLALVGVLGPGDGSGEVITVSHTFAATAEAIVAAGYRPVLVDVDPHTFLMDLRAVEAARTSNTVAVVPVHLYGHMVDVEQLRDWADRYRIAVIEDAAQAHGARMNGMGPGQRSHAAAFSFFPGKNLGAWGDAGAVVTDDGPTARRISQLVDHGRGDKYSHARIGCNARMDALQAAVLRVKLPHLDRWNSARRQVARWYEELLGEVGGCVTPALMPGAQHVYHQYVIQVEHRDEVQQALNAQGIATGIHYPIPVHEQPAFAYLGIRPDDLPITHGLCRHILSLPVFPELTQAQVERVSTALSEALGVTTGAGAR
ncbi:MAG TPA: DegT/DnrJ/EryC1/StrS family aminotransferase [Phycisphaerae bacterium]|nr:DegT/DnrJ/EryC1/StrS family aminotransferase [Phycisphaerae bacterium]HNU45248.1 DegT/DnrJ/EryC1/StrS family aminotransferase [Phycisphaerae bacterium]